MNVVLITGTRAPIALDLARSFAAAGWTPHLADCIAPWTARMSRVAKGRLHRIAAPRYAFESFTADLARLVRELEPEMIVPTCEEVFYLAEAAQRLGISDRLFAPPLQTLRRLHSKVQFADLARSCGVAAPETRRATCTADLAPFQQDARRMVFKPEFSRFASNTLVQPTAARARRLTPTPDAPWAIQDFVEGEELCLWSAAVGGEIRAFAAYKPLWRVGRSSSFYFETDTDPALFEMAQAIIGCVQATGQLSFDVIRRPDGVIAPIECNPRGISGLHLFDAHPRLAEAILGRGSLQTPHSSARHLSLAMWILGAPQALARCRLTAFYHDLARSSDVLSAPGERWLGLGALLDAGRFAATGLSRGRSASGQSTDDIEWNGEPIR